MQVRDSFSEKLCAYKKEEVESKVLFGRFCLFDSGATVEARKKEPTFIGTLGLKFNILSPLNKNLSGADTRGRFSYNRFHVSEFLRTFKNSYILIRIPKWYERLSDFNNNSNLKMFSRILKEFSKSL